MADVYRARDQIGGRPVALKVFRPGAADPRRFETETRLLARLEHPNLVRLLDAGERGGVLYLVLELVAGPTLEQRLHSRGPLTAPEAERVGRDVAQALAHVHAHGVVHRDVKPANILLTVDGRALLSDFGVALLGDGSRVTTQGTTIGTAAYLAPEQVTTPDVTSAADVYALGLVLAEALSGQPVFAGTPSEMVSSRVAGDPPLPTGLPTPWIDLLHAMTRRDPTRRPSTATVAAQLGTPTLASADQDTAIIEPGFVEADTAELIGLDNLAAADGTRRLPHTPRAANAPVARPLGLLLGLAAAFVVLLILAVSMAPGRSGSGDGGQAHGSSAEGTSTSAVPATTIAATSVASTVATTVTSTPPTAAPLADPCAELEARKQAIDTEKQQVDETYRDDHDTRERLKEQLEDEKRDLEATKQSFGC